MGNDNWILSFQELEKLNPFENFDEKNSYKIFNTSNLRKLGKQAKQVLRGCDYLRAVSPDLDLRKLPIFNVLNNTNSSEMYIEGYNPYYYENNNKIYLPFWIIKVSKVKFHDCEKYLFDVYYNDLAYTVLEISFYYWNNAKATINNIWCMIDFKGKPFRLEAMTDWIFKPYEFLKGVLLTDYNEDWKLEFDILNWRLEFKLAEYLANFHITRYDLRFDFFLPKWHEGLSENQVLLKSKTTSSDYFQYLKKFKRKYNNCPYWIKDKQGKIYTGRCVWTRSSKYAMIRFYQKQVDSWCKWLSELYSEYMNFDWEVRRLEIELWNKFCYQKNDGIKFNFYEEFEEKLLTDRALQYVWIKEKTCNFCPRYKAPELSIDKYSFKSLKTKYIKTQNAIRFFCLNWFNRYEFVDICLSDYEKYENDKIDKWKTKMKIEKMLE